MWCRPSTGQRAARGEPTAGCARTSLVLDDSFSPLAEAASSRGLLLPSLRSRRADSAPPTTCARR